VGGTWTVDSGCSRVSVGRSGEGAETGDDPASAARTPERAIVLVVAGAGLACATWDRGIAVVLVQAGEWWILRSVLDEDENLSAGEIVVLDAETGAQGLIVQETSALER